MSFIRHANPNFKSYDFVSGIDSAYLSKAGGVIKVIIDYSSASVADIIAMRPSARDAVFEEGFMALCRNAFPGESDEEISQRRVGENSSVTETQ